jgi:hypothetical protein
MRGLGVLILAMIRMGRRDIGNPIVPPTAQVTDNNEKPRAMFVLSVSSAIILFMTPVFPLSVPFKQRLAKPSYRGRATPQIGDGHT